MFDAWKIGIVVSATTNAPQMFAGISTQARMAAINADLAAGRINAAGAASQRNALRLASANQRMGQMAGLAAGAVSFMAGAFIVDGVRAAGELQRAMIAVQNATGATGQSLTDLQSLVVKTSGLTAQSANTIAEEMAMAARSGLNNVGQLTSLFPLLARFADIQFLSPAHEDPVEAIRQAVQIAHYLKAYTPASLAPILELVNKTMQMQPEDLGKIVRQGKYFMPLASDLGMSAKDIFTITALMGQTGFLLGRGGTSIENFLAGMLKGPNTLTAHLQAKQLNALRDLGLMDAHGNMRFFSGGRLHATDALRQLQGDEKRFGQGGAIRVAGDLLAAFGKQASQFLLTISDPIVANRMKQIESQFDKLPSIQQMFDRYIGSFLGGWQQMTTNFRNVSIEIFLPILPYLTAGMKSVSGALMTLSSFLDRHPKAGLATAIGAFVATAGFATYAARQLWNLNTAIGAMGALAKANAATTAGESLLSKMGRFSGAAWLGATAASIGKYLFGFFEHRGPAGAGLLMRQPGIFGTAVDWGAIATSFARVGGTAARFLPAIAAFGSRFVPIIGWVVALGQTVYEFFRHPFQMGEWLGKITGFLTFKFFPGVIQALENGWGTVSTKVGSLWSQILAGFASLLQKLWWVVTHPWDAARVAASAVGGFVTNLGSTIRADYGKASAGFQKGMSQKAHSDILGARHRDIHIHIHTPTHDPKKHAKIVADEFSKLTRQALHSRSNTAVSPFFSRMEVAPA